MICIYSIVFTVDLTFNNLLLRKESVRMKNAFPSSWNLIKQRIPTSRINPYGVLSLLLFFVTNHIKLVRFCRIGCEYIHSTWKRSSSRQSWVQNNSIILRNLKSWYVSLFFHSGMECTIKLEKRDYFSQINNFNIFEFICKFPLSASINNHQ